MVGFRSHQRGATSIFVVVFAAMLFTIISVSFVALMSREQRRSLDDELSQSAYDSAMAGVEDAKRVIMRSKGSGADAATARSAIEAGKCNTVRASGILGGDLSSTEEVMIQSTLSGGGVQLDQAHTCVTIKLESDNYEVGLDEVMKSAMVPLRGVSEFNRVKIEWHAEREDIQSACTTAWGSVVSSDNLCPTGVWGQRLFTPALLRAHFITPKPGFSHDDLNDPEAGNTLFLYPTRTAVGANLSALDRFVDGNGVTGGAHHRPVGAVCLLKFEAAATYQCETTIDMPRLIEADSQLAFLRLTALYNPTKARVTLMRDANEVDFKGVQPVVDSTGRANDLFRRIEARLALVSDTTFPEAAVDIDGSLCKNFWVSSSSAGVVNGLTCAH